MEDDTLQARETDFIGAGAACALEDAGDDGAHVTATEAGESFDEPACDQDDIEAAPEDRSGALAEAAAELSAAATVVDGRRAPARPLALWLAAGASLLVHSVFVAACFALGVAFHLGPSAVRRGSGETGSAAASTLWAGEEQATAASPALPQPGPPPARDVNPWATSAVTPDVEPPPALPPSPLRAPEPAAPPEADPVVQPFLPTPGLTDVVPAFARRGAPTFAGGGTPSAESGGASPVPAASQSSPAGPTAGGGGGGQVATAEVVTPPRVAGGGAAAGRSGRRDGYDDRGLPIPEYPPECRRRREQGLVVLRVEILPDGRVGEVVVVKDPGFPKLVAVATAAVRRGDFEPGTRGGKPRAGYITIPYRFVLD